MYSLPMGGEKDNISIPTRLYNYLKDNNIKYDIDFESKCLVFNSQEDLDKVNNILSERPVVEPIKKEEPIKKKGRLF